MVGILVDVTACTGCERCVGACMARQAGPDVAALSEVGRDLSASRLCAIEQVGQDRFARRSCLHCLEPACVAACLVGGLTKTDQGPVLYDRDTCIGCRYCMLACPHHVPRYEWDRQLPYVRKCDLCWERLQQGEIPACVEACPSQALHFGDRDALLVKAHDLVLSHRSRYLPRVWGEHERGGTSVLFISDVDLASLDFPDPATPAIPSLTDPLIEKTPFMGAGVGFGLWALATIINRRNTVMAATRTGTNPDPLDPDRRPDGPTRATKDDTHA